MKKIHTIFEVLAVLASILFMININEKNPFIDMVLYGMLPFWGAGIYIIICDIFAPEKEDILHGYLSDIFKYFQKK